MADAQYDPSKVVITVGGFVMKKFAADSMVTVSYGEDKNTKHIGVDGYGRWTSGKNDSGQVTLTLSSYSSSNQVLTTLMKADQPVPISIIDKSSDGESFFADSCKVETRPDLEKAREETEKTWVFGFIKGEAIYAGAKEV